MSVAWGNSENIYSLGVLRPVTGIGHQCARAESPHRCSKSDAHIRAQRQSNSNLQVPREPWLLVFAYLGATLTFQQTACPGFCWLRWPVESQPWGLLRRISVLAPTVMSNVAVINTKASAPPSGQLACSEICV